MSHTWRRVVLIWEYSRQSCYSFCFSASSFLLFFRIWVLWTNRPIDRSHRLNIRQTDRWTDWPTDHPTDKVTGWLTLDRFSDLWANTPTDRQTDRRLGRPYYARARMTDWQSTQTATRLTDRSTISLCLLSFCLSAISISCRGNLVWVVVSAFGRAARQKFQNSWAWVA